MSFFTCNVQLWEAHALTDTLWLKLSCPTWVSLSWVHRGPATTCSGIVTQFGSHLPSPHWSFSSQTHCDFLLHPFTIEDVTERYVILINTRGAPAYNGECSDVCGFKLLHLIIMISRPLTMIYPQNCSGYFNLDVGAAPLLQA